MANFHAKDYGTVQYNFHPDAPGIKGVIPDPSDDMLQTYHTQINGLMRESGINDLPSDTELRLHPERMDEYMDRLESFNAIDTHHKLVAIVAELCSDSPSVDDMMKLPYRKRVKFIRFAQKELASPEL